MRKLQHCLSDCVIAEVGLELASNQMLFPYKMREGCPLLPHLLSPKLHSVSRGNNCLVCILLDQNLQFCLLSISSSFSVSIYQSHFFLAPVFGIPHYEFTLKSFSFWWTFRYFPNFHVCVWFWIGIFWIYCEEGADGLGWQCEEKNSGSFSLPLFWPHFIHLSVTNNLVALWE